MELRDVWGDRPRVVDTALDDPARIFDTIEATGAVWTVTAAFRRFYEAAAVPAVPLGAPPLATGVTVAEDEERMHVTVFEDLVAQAARTLQPLVPESFPVPTS